jgi:hypothetical protein
LRLLEFKDTTVQLVGAGSLTAVRPSGPPSILFGRTAINLNSCSLSTNAATAAPLPSTSNRLTTSSLPGCSSALRLDTSPVAGRAIPRT